MIKLNPNYWDCECEHDFIHPKEMYYCVLCGAYKDDQPDSRENEIKNLPNTHMNF